MGACVICFMLSEDNRGNERTRRKRKNKSESLESGSQKAFDHTTTEK